MNNPNKFKERQRFNDKLVYILLGVGLLGTLFGLARSLVIEQNNPTASLAFLAIAIILGFQIWWLRRLRLKVSVDEERIKYKLSPLHKKARKIFWDEVASCKIVKTPLAAQWHGGNMRFVGESWVSLTGRNGMSIETKDGRRLFIGCKAVDDLTTFLENTPVNNQEN